MTEQQKKALEKQPWNTVDTVDLDEKITDYCTQLGIKSPFGTS